MKNIYDKDEGGLVQILFCCFVAGGNNCFALIQQLRPGQPLENILEKFTMK